MIEIRPATPEDAPEMARVIVDTWFAAHEGQVPEERFLQRRREWGYPESEQGWRRLMGEAGKVSAHVLVAADDGRIIAVAASQVTGTVAETGALYVDVPYQRSGVGRSLVAATIEHYRNVGTAKLQIAVLATNLPARRFYERLGGVESGTRDDPDGLEVLYAWDLTDCLVDEMARKR